MMTAALPTTFDQRDALATHAQWGQLIKVLESSHPKLAELMNDAEHDVLAYKSFPREHWSQLHSTISPERLDKEIKRRTRVVGVFPNDPAIVRLVGAMMLEQNDERPPSLHDAGDHRECCVCDDHQNVGVAKLEALYLSTTGFVETDLHHLRGRYQIRFGAFGGLKKRVV